MIKKGGQFVSISAIENEFINISYIDELSIIPIEDEFWGSKILLFYFFTFKWHIYILSKYI